MRYIHKNIYSKAHKLLEDWNRLRVIAGQKLAYDEFEHKKKLNDLLIEEQGGICCYCQQKITELRRTRSSGDAHNEHLIPQSARKDLQTNHGNIFACCCFSSGFSKDLQYCGEAKKEKRIYDFIKWVDCNCCFKYNIEGEIIPEGSYRSFEEFSINMESLTFKQKKALEIIETLNLNAVSLKEERKKDIIALIKMLNKLSKEEVQEKIKEFKVKPHFRFVDMLLYYMKQKK
jgi:uncharacterized protein (TIGR02646 family)